ncbi:MAG: hypothetical protein AAF519_17220 [Bacteroidota bacterium]
MESSKPMTFEKRNTLLPEKMEVFSLHSSSEALIRKRGVLLKSMSMEFDLTKSNPAENLSMIVVFLQLFTSYTRDFLIPSGEEVDPDKLSAFPFQQPLIQDFSTNFCKLSNTTLSHYFHGYTQNTAI